MKLSDFAAKAAKDVLDERERQIDLAIGGNTEKFDRENDQNDWVAFIVTYAGRAADRTSCNSEEGQDFRENMVKVGALALAAIEAFDKDYCPPRNV